MKKFYAAIVFSLLTFGVFAQCTPDNSLTQPGYSPNELDTAFVGDNYEMVVHIRIPKDTVVTFFGQTITADIDSIRLVDVVGFPPNFTYQCNVASCTFTPTQTYCAKIEGTATSNDVGAYPLRFAVIAYASAVVFGTRTALPPQADTLDQFELIVANKGGGTSNLAEIKAKEVFSIYPNPAQKQFTILLHGNVNETISYEVVDITGKKLAEKVTSLASTSGIISINSERWANGIYFIRVQNAKGIFTQRLVIEN